ncbi:hypothetical protein GCK72_022768 [Caenorhabditis remanei]|uniref:Uncharacterized protein n=1 Tax=Caenorhabditis remanei TaxID=31234 RepID=A0A6A5FUY6_CAERE|nr:hypothetical protein GCK72_022768 [Caenorhabditis remanei]KAF1746315.1 hypothetical protein GCK72_022768 [Caenorhabditis remanei]
MRTLCQFESDTKATCTASEQIFPMKDFPHPIWRGTGEEWNGSFNLAVSTVVLFDLAWTLRIRSQSTHRKALKNTQTSPLKLWEKVAGRSAKRANEVATWEDGLHELEHFIGDVLESV